MPSRPDLCRSIPDRSARKCAAAMVFTRDRDQEMYDQHMREYLGIDEEVLKEIASKA